MAADRYKVNCETGCLIMVCLFYDLSFLIIFNNISYTSISSSRVI